MFNSKQRKQQNYLPRKTKEAASESVDEKWNGRLKATQSNLFSGWYTDSGITSHITYNQEFFSDFDFSTKGRLSLQMEKNINAEEIRYRFYGPSKGTHKLLVKNVLDVPWREISCL